MKKFKTIISGALAACMVIGATLFTGCTTDKKAENENEPPATAQEQIYSMGYIEIDGLKPLSAETKASVWDQDFLNFEYEEKMIGITATVSGYTGEVPELEWYVEWSAGEWGIGKNVSKYITLKTIAGSNTEVVAICHRPFLASIYVYARVKNQPDVKARCELVFMGKW